MKIIFYNAYIMSCIDYCCPVWGGTSRNQNIILKSQKRVARLILNKHAQTSSKSMFTDLKWLTFEQGYNYYIALLVIIILRQGTFVIFWPFQIMNTTNYVLLLKMI